MAALWARVLVWANARGVDSHGVLRMRATLTEVTPKGEVWLGQQVFTAQQPAASADAAGGAAALGAATDQVAQQLDAWLRKLGR